MEEIIKLRISYESDEWDVKKTPDEVKSFFRFVQKLEKKHLKKGFSNKGKNSESLSTQIKNIRNSGWKSEDLKSFFLDLGSIAWIKKDPVFKEFIEYSVHSRNYDQKRKEGYIFLHNRDSLGNEFNYLDFLCCRVCSRPKRWMIITNSFVAYSSSPNSLELLEVLMFKDSFTLCSNPSETGYPDAIIIRTLKTKLLFHAGSITKKNEWALAIQESFKESEWGSIDPRYGSSFPPRFGNQAKFFVDGENYFKETYYELLKAKEQVFITDWWLCPELYLLRPASAFPETQILKVLKKISDDGVKIFVTMYREIPNATNQNSKYSQEILEKYIENNLRVIRHPEFRKGNWFWSHHEKYICIDQTTAFLGGLDMCYGRWDTNSHLLIDTDEPNTWNGTDYCNDRLRGLKDVTHAENSPIDRYTEQRMPWHDIGIKLVGPVAEDISINFIEFWNYAITEIAEDSVVERKQLIVPRKSTKRKTNVSYKDQTDLLRFNTIKDDSSQVFSQESLNSEENLPALMKNAISEKIFNSEEEDRSCKEKEVVSPINPFENEDSELLNQISSISDENKHFSLIGTLDSNISKIFKSSSFISNQKKLVSSKKTENPAILSLTPQLSLEKKRNSTISPEKSPKRIKTANIQILELQQSMIANKNANKVPKASNSATKNLLIHSIRKAINASKLLSPSKSPPERIIEEPKTVKKEALKLLTKNKNNLNIFTKFLTKNINEIYQDEHCECELIRSAGKWSYGLKETESSIHLAYLTLISEANHFIYIENQFFISSTAGKKVSNTIVQALVKRIVRAAENKERFKVMVFVPLLPGFEGDIFDDSADILRVQLYWEYQTINRSENSLFKQLQAKDINPYDYIRFYSLRTHGLLNNTPVTEIIYIHSKMMIVDDDIAIIGSANINDRSQLGDRDSEIAIVIRDTHKTNSFMGGIPWTCGEFTLNLRKQLFKEFIGDANFDISDPLSLEFQNNWNNLAKKNTNIYFEVFKCYPDDIYDSYEKIKVSLTNNSQEEFENEKKYKYEALASQISGFLVEFPLEFLSREDLNFTGLTIKKFMTQLFV